MTSKMVALCLLRLLPRGGSRFRVWLGKRLVRIEFERQTRRLRAWRVFMMREHGKAYLGERAVDVTTVTLFNELRWKVPQFVDLFVYDGAQRSVDMGICKHKNARRWKRLIKPYY